MTYLGSLGSGNIAMTASSSSSRSGRPSFAREWCSAPARNASRSRRSSSRRRRPLSARESSRSFMSRLSAFSGASQHESELVATRQKLINCPPIESRAEWPVAVRQWV